MTSRAKMRIFSAIVSLSATLSQNKLPYHTNLEVIPHFILNISCTFATSENDSGSWSIYWYDLLKNIFDALEFCFGFVLVQNNIWIMHSIIIYILIYVLHLLVSCILPFFFFFLIFLDSGQWLTVLRWFLLHRRTCLLLWWCTWESGWSHWARTF